MRLRYILSVATSLLTLAAFVLGSVYLVNSIRTRNQDQAKICRVAQRNQQSLRQLLQLAQRTSRVTLRDRPVQLREAQRFYMEALALLRPVDCRKL